MSTTLTPFSWSDAEPVATVVPTPAAQSNAAPGVAVVPVPAPQSDTAPAPASPPTPIAQSNSPAAAISIAASIWAGAGVGAAVVPIPTPQSNEVPSPAVVPGPTPQSDYAPGAREAIDGLTEYLTLADGDTLAVGSDILTCTATPVAPPPLPRDADSARNVAPEPILTW